MYPYTLKVLSGSLCMILLSQEAYMRKYLFLPLVKFHMLVGSAVFEEIVEVLSQSWRRRRRRRRRRRPASCENFDIF